MPKLNASLPIDCCWLTVLMPSLHAGLPGVLPEEIPEMHDMGCRSPTTAEASHLSIDLNVLCNKHMLQAFIYCFCATITSCFCSCQQHLTEAELLDSSLRTADRAA
eukprot:1158950-Pelagomonas_calceolata.AAC.4